jgi:putative membrane protein
VNESPDSRFEGKDLSLQEQLEINLTILANEETLLAYLRTGVALLIAGALILYFSIAGWFWSVGIVCIPIGIITAIVGVARYRRMKRSISIIRR